MASQNTTTPPISASLDDDGNSEERPVHRPQQDPQVFADYNPSRGIQSPQPHDVICGRGKMTIAHPGNRQFRDLVMERKEAYQLARRRDDKTRITFELVQKLRDRGSKFLLFDTNSKVWYDVGDDYAREKISHSLRSRPNEQRRAKPKPRKKASLRKSQHSPALDGIVTQLIHDQQALLKTMISRETERASVEAAERATEAVV